jgi:hypothetical protein
LVELIEKDLDFEEELENLKVLLSRINFWTYKCKENLFDFDILIF